MTAPIRLRELDQLLEQVQRGGDRYGADAHAAGTAARRSIVNQFAELACLITPAEGNPLEVVRATFDRTWPGARDTVRRDRFCREVVGALALFARPGSE